MPTDPQPLHRWLSHQPKTVRELLGRAQRLAEINQALQEHWQCEPWIHTVRVANVRGTTVVVFAQSAASLIPLRYRKDALISFLRQRFGLSCTELDLKVRPDS